MTFSLCYTKLYKTVITELQYQIYRVEESVKQESYCKITNEENNKQNRYGSWNMFLCLTIH